jgi:hypothetical protein
MEETKKIEVEDAGIDREIVEELAKENILNSLTDDKQIRRVEINFYCEMLAELKNLDNSVGNLVNIFSICANKQLTEFFSGVNDNIKKEQVKKNVENIVEKSHKKPQKSKKSVK